MYAAEWIKGKEWGIYDLKKDTFAVTGLSQSTAKFVCLVLNLRSKKV
jgi:hypothetical protein